MLYDAAYESMKWYLSTESVHEVIKVNFSEMWHGGSLTGDQRPVTVNEAGWGGGVIWTRCIDRLISSNIHGSDDLWVSLFLT